MNDFFLPSRKLSRNYARKIKSRNVKCKHCPTLFHLNGMNWDSWLASSIIFFLWGRKIGFLSHTLKLDYSDGETWYSDVYNKFKLHNGLCSSKDHKLQKIALKTQVNSFYKEGERNYTYFQVLRRIYVL